MKDVDTAISAVKLAIATAEALSGALGDAKKQLDSGADQLRDVLAQIERDRESMHETLARDRREARDDFDKKFADAPDDATDDPAD